MNPNISTTLPTYLQSLLPKTLHPFLLLSYPIPPSPKSYIQSLTHSTRKSSPSSSPTLYSRGIHDIYFVTFCAIAFTLLREIMLRYILRWFAGWVLRRRRKGQEEGLVKGVDRGVWERRQKRRDEHVITRFAEQGWSFIYCTVFWTLGMIILSRIPSYSLTPIQLWATYPIKHLPSLTKFYYLAQLGWWFHQIYAINTEKRRNDHWQMFTHHVLTIALITASYLTNFTRVGTVIHVLMDFCDILLSLAKMLRYLSFTTACDITFVFFLLSWLISRQIGLGLVIRSTYLDAHRYIPDVWDPARGLYFTSNVRIGFLVMLGLLFCLMTAWFYMACMVAIRVVRGLGAEDSRSDEGEEESGVGTPTLGGDGAGSEVLGEVADVHHDEAMGMGGRGGERIVEGIESVVEDVKEKTANGGVNGRTQLGRVNGDGDLRRRK